jgi:hypothetical protein
MPSLCRSTCFVIFEQRRNVEALLLCGSRSKREVAEIVGILSIFCNGGVEAAILPIVLLLRGNKYNGKSIIKMTESIVFKNHYRNFQF